MRKPSDELRQVTVLQGAVNKGFFHRWCREPFYNENGSYLTKTFALVELSNGRVELVEPNTIKFITPYQEDTQSELGSKLPSGT